MFDVSVRTYVIAGAPPRESELVQVTLNLIPERSPALNPGFISPVNP